MVYVVGLAGPGRVGKSTTARNLVSSFHKTHPLLKVERYAFASLIYEITSTLTGIPIDVLKNEKYKETPWDETTTPLTCLKEWTPRKLLQIIGTECFRNNVSYDFWVQAAIMKVCHLDIVFIEDARFDNEFEKCDMVIELHRLGIDYAKNHQSAMPPDNKHIDIHLHLYPDMIYDDIINDVFMKYKLSTVEKLF